MNNCGCGAVRREYKRIIEKQQRIRGADSLLFLLLLIYAIVATATGVGARFT